MGYHKGEDTLMEGAVEMYQWERQIQSIVDEIDRCIRQQDSLTILLESIWLSSIGTPRPGMPARIC